ncbi:iron-containing alcohol dehydrogenase [Streptomyces reniochalinae]|uniref:Iron-containing alcohol dehydrogenase n=1 Tax=Streptomyces reniochalinae TaxID=2250578 RepID=A0A367E6J6_9ACTN|nr:iron-containing alcohol dehydrogenase [Streptomyces reniochalinae]RCG13674.1 iron-containing alcohol dehydrogenase [Streptomyces reniochalinae]
MSSARTEAVFNFAQPRDMRVGGGGLNRIGEVMTALGASRPLIVTDAFLVSTGLAEQTAALLRDAGCAPSVFSETIPDPTTDSLVKGLEAIRADDCDVLIGLGGGSPMDTAKALALLSVQGGEMRDYKAPRHNTAAALPIVAVPTTAGSGSEATQFTIITDSGSDEKMLCTGRSFLPAAAIIDFELTTSMPARLTADTGIDALTHAVEAYVSKRANPLSDALALTAISTVGDNLRRVVDNGEDRSARAAMMLAATQAGIAFSNSSVALVHGMSRPIGAHFHVAHGLSNAMLFPAVTAFSAFADPAATARYAACSRAFGAATASDSDQAAAGALVDAIGRLCGDLKVPTPHEFGIDEAHWNRLIPLMAEQALSSGSPANNPRVPSAEEIAQLYTQIYR